MTIELVPLLSLIHTHNFIPIVTHGSSSNNDEIFVHSKKKKEGNNGSGSGGGVMISMLCKSLLLLNVFHASCDNKIKVEVNSG
jgi:hypothetical protein